MPYPNTLIFVDLASDDPAAAGRFYAEVFGWQDDPRPQGVYHRMVPGQEFLAGTAARAASATCISGSSMPPTRGRIRSPPGWSRGCWIARGDGRGSGS